MCIYGKIDMWAILEHNRRTKQHRGLEAELCIHKGNKWDYS
jgi:hypothetical protein